MRHYNINYNKIFSDILDKKYPEKREQCRTILQKKTLSAIDIIELNKKIFGTDRDNITTNQQHRSYSKFDILQILDYQKKYNLNNSQLANHFKLSRNTIAKWKKIFQT